MIRLVSILVISLFYRTVTAQVKLPRLISDNMVLQRDAKLTLWGWAAVGEKVSCRFINKTYMTTTGADSMWTITLPALKAGGPYDMEITGSNRIMIKNMLVGDVWVCSGQSNMELPMERVKEKYAAVIAQAANPAIRQFNVSTTYDFQQERKDFESGSWQSGDPQTVLQFTAVGYFFARTLYEKYKVPIGLIKASVGGSPAEAWLNAEALKVFPQHLEVAARYKRAGYIDRIRNNDKLIRDTWYQTLWQNDKGLHDATRWYDTAYNVSGWSTMPVPGYWDEHGLKDVNGVVWFRKDVEVPASMTGKPVKLLLGRIVDQDSVFVNGRFAGTTGYQYPPRRYELPAGLLHPGRNTIVVRVINNAGRGGFVSDKPYQLIAGDETLSLTGDWHFALGTTAPPLPSQTFVQYQPTGLFNAMISPLLNYRIKGVIWYQGESNAGRPVEYRTLFPAVINTWRQQWARGDFPFLFVQLANYMQTKDKPGESSWAMTREAQLKTLSLPNTGMAVITDLGEWNDIHPLNKEDVGKRLALWAQKQAYGDKKVVYSGPLYQSMIKQDNKIVLQFTSTGSGLMAKGNSELKQFAIAGADKKFVWAKAVIEGNRVVVWSEQVQDPVAVRYAWADNPEGANLYNKDGLPASSFRTDSW
jgi:sialate O-acetylesterase